MPIRTLTVNLMIRARTPKEKDEHSNVSIVRVRVMTDGVWPLLIDFKRRGPKIMSRIVKAVHWQSFVIVRVLYLTILTAFNERSQAFNFSTVFVHCFRLTSVSIPVCSVLSSTHPSAARLHRPLLQNYSDQIKKCFWRSVQEIVYD